MIYKYAKGNKTFEYWLHLFFFHLTDGNTGNVFAVDVVSGNVTLQTAVSPTTVEELTYNLVLQANDSVNTAVLNLTVQVKTGKYISLMQCKGRELLS